MPEPVMRLAGDSDQIAVEQLTLKAYAPWTALLGAAPLPVTEAYGPRIARDEVWLLEDGPTPLGLIVLESADDHLLIFSIAVSPEHQGRGYGARLLEFAEEQARLKSLGEIRLYTNARMERNIALYERRGYAETGRRPNSKRAGWTVVDMAKRLSETA